MAVIEGRRKIFGEGRRKKEEGRRKKEEVRRKEGRSRFSAHNM
ncbi:hypothetical protein QUB60_09935 [Microcoleus sp. A2-C5]|nr:hypothetical protein [Lyngbya sp. CCAP 1446/10]